jgi:hypothetical protein
MILESFPVRSLYRIGRANGMPVMPVTETPQLLAAKRFSVLSLQPSCVAKLPMGHLVKGARGSFA